jgi:hypothetical protein
MKEIPRSRITVTSSLNEISTDQLGNRVVKSGEAPPAHSISVARFWMDTEIRREGGFLSVTSVTSLRVIFGFLKGALSSLKKFQDEFSELSNSFHRVSKIMIFHFLLNKAAKKILILQRKYRKYDMT